MFTIVQDCDTVQDHYDEDDGVRGQEQDVDTVELFEKVLLEG